MQGLQTRRADPDKVAKKAAPPKASQSRIA
jgi:hypothetical protein